MAIQDTKVNSPLGSLPHRLPLLLKADYCLYLGKDAVAWSGGGRFATSNFNLNCLVELEQTPASLLFERYHYWNMMFEDVFYSPQRFHPKLVRLLKG
jgi:hypothetical protein